MLNWDWDKSNTCPISLPSITPYHSTIYGVFIPSLEIRDSMSAVIMESKDKPPGKVLAALIGEAWEWIPLLGVEESVTELEPWPEEGVEGGEGIDGVDGAVGGVEGVDPDSFGSSSTDGNLILSQYI
jgi:hypothetical protein